MDIYASYNISDFARLTSDSLFDKLKALATSLAIYFKYRDGDKLLTLHYRGYHIGEHIYDTILRCDFSRVTIDKVPFRRGFTKIYNSILGIIGAEKLYSKYPFSALVYSDCDYMPGRALQLVAIKHKAKLYYTNGLNNIICRYDTDHMSLPHVKNILYPVWESWQKFLKQPDIDKLVDNYIAERFKGEAANQFDTGAFKNKRSYTRSELLAKFKLDSNKKNVVIAAHVFSDLAHYSFYQLHRDYYEWLMVTVKILSRNKNVNTFLKVHPSTHLYFEEGGVEKLLQKSGVNNVYLMPDDLNTAAIPDIADYIVTQSGTMGLEMAGFGIPVFTAAKGYYCDFGIDIYSSTDKEYEERLLHIENTPRLSAETSRRARQALYYIYANKGAWRPRLGTPEIFTMGTNQSKDKDYWVMLCVKQWQDINSAIKNGANIKDDFYKNQLNAIEIVDNDLWNKYKVEFSDE